MADAAPDIAPFKIERLRKRPEFLACAKAPACARGAVLVQALARDDQPLVRAGFTATKRIAPSAASGPAHDSFCPPSATRDSTMSSSQEAVSLPVPGTDCLTI